MERGLIFMTDYKALENEYGVPLQPKRDLVAVRGSGACLYDEAGQEYLDCVGGIGVASLGHSHPSLVEAIRQQAETLITCPNIMYNDVRSNLLNILSLFFLVTGRFFINQIIIKIDPSFNMPTVFNNDRFDHLDKRIYLILNCLWIDIFSMG